MRSLIVLRNSMICSPFGKELSEAGSSPGCRTNSERRAADAAVARAELIGLQAVEDAQDLFRVAADVEVVHAHVLDRAFGIDDEGRAQRHAFVLVTNAELVDERALRITEAPVAELRQVLVVA